MKTPSIEKIFSQFTHKGSFLDYEELVSGHINDTYRIKTDVGTDYVLQRINHQVFPNVPGLANNKVLVSKHLLNNLNKLPKESNKRVLEFVPLKTENIFYLKEYENYWMLSVFIDNALTFEVVTDEAIAYEAGKTMGHFLNQTSDFNADLLTEVLPKFHDMRFRFEQFRKALKTATEERLQLAASCISRINELETEMMILQNLKNEGKIPIRLTHNDTKVSNILFGKNKKGLCVIDTDTIMPGIVHYDFGDAIRTICNTAAEDEVDLEKIQFNFDFYKAYQKGFLEEMKNSLTETEIKYLPLGAKMMIFIMALRFLTDFLNNDIYYKTKYVTHNLVRSKNQLKLISDLESYF